MFYAAVSAKASPSSRYLLLGVILAFLLLMLLLLVLLCFVQRNRTGTYRGNR